MTVSKTKQSVYVVVSCLVIAAIALFVFWQPAVVDETGPKKQLTDLGALVVMDGTGRQITSVVFSTIEELDKVRAALKIAESLKSPTAYDLSRTEIENGDLQRVRSQTGLFSLGLSSTNIDDAGIAHLTGLQNLESLHLSNTQVSDRCLSHLQELRSLKVLDLSNTRVSSDLSPLARMPALTWVLFCNMTLREGALQGLCNSPSLHRVSLTESDYPRQDVAALRSALPSLTIDESTSKTTKN